MQKPKKDKAQVQRQSRIYEHPAEGINRNKKWEGMDIGERAESNLQKERLTNRC